MNRRMYLAALAIVLSLLPFATARAMDVRTLEFAPAPLGNPLIGLVPYAGKGTNADGSEIFPHSLEFSYLSLGRLMTGMNEFNWRPLEDLLNDVSGRGRQAVFRVYLEYPGRRNVIPEFLVKGGLEVHVYTNTNTQVQSPKVIETPDYEDPQLRQALENFIAALGERYDDDPRIGFISAGLLGAWGEWHVHPRNDLWAGMETQRLVMDAYTRSFKKTHVLLRYPAGENDPSYVANSKLPFGYHDDSFAYATRDTGDGSDAWFFVTKLMNAGALDKWKQHPIGGEIRPEVWGCCFDDPPCSPAGQSFDACVDDTHVSWLMDSGAFGRRMTEQRRRNAEASVRRMGYAFQITRAVFPARVTGDLFDLSLSITNHGAAPFYSDWPIELDVTDINGKSVRTFETNLKLTKINPGDPEASRTTRLDSGSLPAGYYRLLLRVRNPLTNGRPLRFANATQDQDAAGWLTLGAFERGAE